MDENLAKLLEAVEAVKAGDKDAFQEIYHRTYQKTYKIARGFFPNSEQDQDDCVQTIYMHLYRKIGFYKSENGSFMSWFTVVAENVCRDEYARIAKKKGYEVSLDGMKMNQDSDETVELEDEDLTFNPEAQVDRSETRRLVREIVDTLPEKLRQTVMLYYSGDYKQKDVARLLGISVPAVKNRLGSGKKLIEEQVLSLQKQGVKLYSMAPISFFAWLLSNDAKLEAEAAATASFDISLLAAESADSLSGTAEAGRSIAAESAQEAGAAGVKTAIGGAKKVAGFVKAKAWIAAHVKLVSVIACVAGVGAVGTAVYALTADNTPDPVPVVEEVDAPLINVYSDKIYAGIDQEVSVQEEIIRSVVSYGEEAEVTISCENASVTDGSGADQNGVPDIRISFEQAGEYEVNITAEAEETSEKSVHVTVTGKLASYVKGIKDWNVQEGAEKIDFMDGVEWDEAYVKEVTVDAGKVDLAKAGDYTIVYTVSPVSEDQEAETIEAAVHVLKKEVVEQKAEKGEAVVASGNKAVTVKPAEPEKAVTKKEPVKETSKPSTNTPVKEEKPSTNTPVKEDKPAVHTHNWQKRTETINHPEESHIEYVDHPAEGHTEYIEHPEESHIESKWVYQCNGCKKKYYSYDEIGKHQEEQMIAGNIACGGYSEFKESTTVIDKEAWTEEVWVVDKEAWTEEVKVVDKKAWTETKTYYECSCGATK